MQDGPQQLDMASVRGMPLSVYATLMLIDFIPAMGVSSATVQVRVYTPRIGFAASA